MSRLFIVDNFLLCRVTEVGGRGKDGRKGENKLQWDREKTHAAPGAVSGRPCDSRQRNLCQQVWLEESSWKEWKNELGSLVSKKRNQGSAWMQVVRLLHSLLVHS